ncbi:MAG: HD domain-containing protein, partial [Erysipelotrichaceae bacterium]
MKPTELLSFLSVVEKLKSNTRHSWTSEGKQESVAAHSWRLSLFALLIKDEVVDVDIDKVIKMCIVHDFGEAITGDIPSFLKSEQHDEIESNAVYELLKTLPQSKCDELTTLFQEMDAQKTREARLYKALDKMEAVIQHNESDLSTWIPLEYELNQTYAQENAEEFPFLKELREQMKQDTLHKIDKK